MPRRRGTGLSLAEWLVLCLVSQRPAEALGCHRCLTLSGRAVPRCPAVRSGRIVPQAPFGPASDGLLLPPQP